MRQGRRGRVREVESAAEGVDANTHGDLKLLKGSDIGGSSERIQGAGTLR